jgi:hypothetical protein
MRDEKCVKGITLKPERTRHLRRPRRRYKYNIKMGLKEIVCVDWIQLMLD